MISPIVDDPCEVLSAFISSSISGFFVSRSVKCNAVIDVLVVLLLVFFFDDGFVVLLVDVVVVVLFVVVVVSPQGGNRWNNGCRLLYELDVTRAYDTTSSTIIHSKCWSVIVVANEYSFPSFFL